MPKFVFASLRGDDFESEGENVFEAYRNLCEREKDNGTLWRLFDDSRIEKAIELEGFHLWNGVAVKEVQI